MFWGKGDSSKLTPKQRTALEELRGLVESGHIIALTPEQTSVAISAINFYAAVQSAASLMITIRNILLFLGSILGVWWLAHDTVIELIQKVAAGGPPS